MKRQRQSYNSVSWIIKSLFVILTTGIDGGISLTVTQSPPEIRVKRGSSFKLLCQWNTTKTLQEVSVSWSKDNADQIKHIRKNYSEYEDTFWKNASMLNDSGNYKCCVAGVIPFFIPDTIGSGSRVIVEDDVHNKEAFPLVIITAACAGGAALLCIAALCCFGFIRAVKRRQRDVPVYMNTPKGFQDKQISSEDERQDKNVDQSANNMASDSSSNKPFHVDPEEIVATRQKLKKKKAHFFTGNTKSNLNKEGRLKRKQSLHLYINSRDLKKQNQQKTEGKLAYKNKPHQPHSPFPNQKVRSEEIYRNV
ncbi:uncharacterized protein LOC136766620 [Amia ocellicauda]|uniref:uncharacterized protein LOC136766620 n=1 Tax=Amia ocellicauda TaxID=2972642 RepID=UPI003463D5EC